MANKEVGDWNPMEEAHGNPTFNSYVEGPGSHLNTNQQPFNRGGGVGRGRNGGSAGHHSNDSEVRLYISNIPLNMTQDGLQNVLMEYAVPKKVYVSDRTKVGYKTTWGTADFATFGDAEATMRGCNEKPPYNLMVKFATKSGPKNNNRDYENQPSGPASPSAPKVNHFPLQEVQPKSDLNRKEALQCKLLIKNCTDTNGTSCPIIQETDKEGFFLLPSRGEVMAVNAKNMLSDRRYASEAGGWKMGVNRKYYPPSPGHSEKLRTGANPSPNKPSNSTRDNATDEVIVRKCKVCMTETSGVCGACKNASYCSQACATADFRQHVTECYVPVPAVLFSDAGNRAVYPPATPERFSTTPPHNVGSPKNRQQVKNGDSPSYNADKAMGAAGDGPYNCQPSDVKKEINNTSMGGNANKDNVPLANGDHKAVFNEQNRADNKSMGIKSYQGGKPTNDWQDRAGNISTSTPNRQSGGRQSGPFTKQANDDNSVIGLASGIKKKQRVMLESLEAGISEEVEVVYSSMHGLFVNKTCNKPALDTLNNGLVSNWASMLPFDIEEEMCVAPFEGGMYRCKVLQNKSTGTAVGPKLRVKYVDFGNITLIHPREVKALPETFFELPAQAIQVKLPDASPDTYSSYEIGAIINVTAIKKVDGSWLVDISEKEAGVAAPSLTVAHTVSPPRQVDAAAVSVSPLARATNVSPAVASTRTLFGQEKKNIVVGELASGTSCVSELPPLGIATMLTITKVTSDQVFWGTLNSRNEEIAAMEAKLNLLLESNPSPYHPNLNDLVAVFHDDCWYRAKVVKLTDLAKMGLIDYGKLIDLPLDMINALPEELKCVPRHAVKYKIPESRPGFLQVDKQICVVRTSTDAVDGSWLVDISEKEAGVAAPSLTVAHTVSPPRQVDAAAVSVSPLARATNVSPAVASTRTLFGQEKKVADVPTNVLPHAAGITSLAVEQLPTGEYSEVFIIEVAGKSFWVYLTRKVSITYDLLTKLNEHCRANPAPCQPQVGDIVAAFFEGDWFRAKVLTVLPKIRVAYVDYGNESEVTADQVKVLPKELSQIPAQAIKITFDKYHDLKVETTAIVKPVAGAEKSADGAVVVQLQGDTPKQVEAEAPTQMSTASKGRWFPLQSVEMPSDIFVQLSVGVPGKTGYACLVENVDATNSMMIKLHELLSQNPVVCQPQVGALVAVQYDNIWHRGKVLTVAPQLQVGLVDFGNTCPMTPDQLFCLPEAVHDFPAQALKVMFMDGTPEMYFNLDEMAVYEGKIQQKLPDGTVVIEARNLIIPKTGAPVDQTMELSPVPAATVAVTASAIMTHSSVTVPEDLPCSKIEQLSATSDNQVMVSYTANGQVWVNLVAKSEDLTKTMADLTLMKSSLQPCNPNVGDYVAVYVASLDIWHRGKIRSMSSGTLNVLLIDYGCDEDVTPNMVKALPAELAKLPAQGIPIQLCAGSAAKCMNPELDDTLYLKLLGTMLDGSVIVLGLDK